MATLTNEIVTELSTIYPYGRMGESIQKLNNKEDIKNFFAEAEWFLSSALSVLEHERTQDTYDFTCKLLYKDLSGYNIDLDSYLENSTDLSSVLDISKTVEEQNHDLRAAHDIITEKQGEGTKVTSVLTQKIFEIANEDEVYKEKALACQDELVTSIYFVTMIAEQQYTEKEKVDATYVNSRRYLNSLKEKIQTL